MPSGWWPGSPAARSGSCCTRSSTRPWTARWSASGSGCWSAWPSPTPRASACPARRSRSGSRSPRSRSTARTLRPPLGAGPATVADAAPGPAGDRLPAAGIPALLVTPLVTLLMTPLAAPLAALLADREEHRVRVLSAADPVGPGQVVVPPGEVLPVERAQPVGVAGEGDHVAGEQRVVADVLDQAGLAGRHGHVVAGHGDVGDLVRPAVAGVVGPVLLDQHDPVAVAAEDVAGDLHVARRGDPDAAGPVALL